MKISVTRKILMDKSLSLNDFSVYLRSDKGKWVNRVEMNKAEFNELVAQGQAILLQVQDGR